MAEEMQLPGRCSCGGSRRADRRAAAPSLAHCWSIPSMVQKLSSGRKMELTFGDRRHDCKENYAQFHTTHFCPLARPFPLSAIHHLPNWPKPSFLRSDDLEESSEQYLHCRPSRCPHHLHPLPHPPQPLLAILHCSLT